jgi:hypothetical protein
MTSRGRTLVGAVIAATLVFGCLGYLWQRTDPSEGAARNYLKALATGDGELACRLVTRPFGQELATRHAVSDCPQGVDAMLAGLSSAQREELGEARLTGSGDTLTVGPNPLGITALRVEKVGDEWMVTGDR